MAKRLVKIAKELNVGTTTIVEHLNKSGFDIENKPTAKITDEMYSELLKAFQKSIAIKEQADQLVIGSRTGKKDAPEEEEKPTVTFTPKKEEAPAPVPPPAPKPAAEETPAPPPAPEPEPEPTPEPVVQEEVAEAPRVQLKIKGKIDLDKPKATPKKEEPAVEVEAPAPTPDPEPEPKKPEPVAEVKEPVAENQEQAPAEKPKEEASPVSGDVPLSKNPKEKPGGANESSPQKEGDKQPPGEGAPKSNEITRMKTPQLKGLKILGKIDTDKLKRPKKKKKKKEEGDNKSGAAANNNSGNKAGSTNNSNNNNSNNNKKKEETDPRKKRRRTRKKVSPVNVNANRGGAGRRRRGGRDEVKEVSKKEIDEQIKQTMARLSGGGKKKRQKMRRESRERLRERQEMREAEKETGKLQLTEFVTVSELASLMDVSVTQVITTCMNLGVIVSINQRLDAEIIELVAEEFGHEVEFISAEEQVDEEEEVVDDPEDLEPRAPIVTVMGHVDHGKTSLLDYIREANVIDGEAGGITQHIGAYEVLVGEEEEEKKRITFLDTPGHEAFTAMRARGAKVTDVAVIIISADDKIMPQTKEAISHAQAAGVPMVFAINKIDKAGADPERIKQELAGMNLLVEAWGGQYQSQDISAKMGTNVDQLLEKILLEAELLELKANPNRSASGTVIEASLDKGRGYVTKILVQTGSLRIGDPVVAGAHSGKIKAMFNERGKKVKVAGPSAPVLVLGLSGAPQAGEKFKTTDTEQEARQIASKRAQISREQANRASKRISLDEIGRRLALGTFKELNLIIKGDVDGSVEALSDSLIKQSMETVQVNVIHKAVGQIIESDVLLASASDAIIIGFQVRPSLNARKLAEREGVQIKTYSIIYEAIEEIRSAIEGMLEPTKEEKIVAQVEVRETYKISRVGTIAGCYVADGKISRNTNIRLIRDGIVVFPTKEGAVGEISSLKRFKDDVKEVKNGMECGITVKNFNDIKVGDVIEGYEIIEVKQRLD
ncbi:MAG: translation initiation factor IF-2 [Bacteroidota bacterium]